MRNEVISVNILKDMRRNLLPRQYVKFKLIKYNVLRNYTECAINITKITILNTSNLIKNYSTELRYQCLACKMKKTCFPIIKY